MRAERRHRGKKKMASLVYLPTWRIWDRNQGNAGAFDGAACFGVYKLSSFRGNCSEVLRRKINQPCLPAAGLHAEDVGVAVKCSFPPTNACINLTHSYYTRLFCRVCSVTEEKKERKKKLNAMQMSWNILPGICIHFHTPPLLLPGFMCTCVLHINDHAETQQFFFCLFLFCVYFAAEMCFLTVHAAVKLTLNYHTETRCMHTHVMYFFSLFFISSWSFTAVSLSADWSISSRLLKNLFCYLRSPFCSPSSSLWGHYRRAEGEKEKDRERRKREAREN